MVAESCRADAERRGAMQPRIKAGPRRALPFAPRPHPLTHNPGPYEAPCGGPESEYLVSLYPYKARAACRHFRGLKSGRFRGRAGTFPGVNNRLGVAVRDMSKGQKWSSK